MGKYYYHGLNHGVVIYTFWSIIDTFEIKSRRLRGCGTAYGTNGFDFISVCKKMDDLEYSKHDNNAFYNYIYNHLCFIIRGDIETIKPKLIDSWEYDYTIKDFDGTNNRFSDMFDEWQVRDKISLDDVVGIGIPLSNLEGKDNYFGYSYDEYINFIEKVRRTTEIYGMDLVDTSDIHFADKYEEKKNNKKSYAIIK